MTLAIRHASNTDRVLQYGTVAATLLNDIGNASEQPYLQAVASISLLIMETDKRAVELVGTIINICGDTEAELAPAMIRSITQFVETLEKILTFVRGQVKGGFWRRVCRAMEDADLFTQCNAGLKDALDVQSGILAAMTIGAMQKEQKKYYDELIAILKKKRSRPKRSSSGGFDGSSRGKIDEQRLS
ncbi:hypothetical protein C8R46DRAFT_1278013 [Mycena filopes]|nr:hypothetical protein C8R46DRAFT_1278013 [Mycena filopes]